jgi:hypothetical protein
MAVLLQWRAQTGWADLAQPFLAAYLTSNSSPYGGFRAADLGFCQFWHPFFCRGFFTNQIILCKTKPISESKNADAFNDSIL